MCSLCKVLILLCGNSDAFRAFFHEIHASAQIADRILVIKGGRIVQDGSHSDLIAVEGEYRAMYEL